MTTIATIQNNGFFGIFKRRELGHVDEQGNVYQKGIFGEQKIGRITNSGAYLDGMFGGETQVASVDSFGKTNPMAAGPIPVPSFLTRNRTNVDDTGTFRLDGIVQKAHITGKLTSRQQEMVAALFQANYVSSLMS